MAGGSLTVKTDELKGATWLNISGEINLTLDQEALKAIGITSDLTVKVKKINLRCGLR